MIHVLGSGAAVEDGEPEDEPTVDLGGAQVSGPVGVHRLQGLPAQRVVIEPEGDDGEIGRPRCVDAVDAGEPGVGPLCQVQTVIEGRPEWRDAMELER